MHLIYFYDKLRWITKTKKTHHSMGMSKLELVCLMLSVMKGCLWGWMRLIWTNDSSFQQHSVIKHHWHLLTIASFCKNHIICLDNEIKLSALTIAVDASNLRQLSSRAALLSIIRNTPIQADQLPLVTTGFVTWHGLHKVRAASWAPCWFVGNLSFPQFETCS